MENLLFLRFRVGFSEDSSFYFVQSKDDQSICFENFLFLLLITSQVLFSDSQLISCADIHYDWCISSSVLSG